MSNLGSFGNHLMLLSSVNIFFTGLLTLTLVRLALFRNRNQTFSWSSTTNTTSKDWPAVSIKQQIHRLIFELSFYSQDLYRDFFFFFFSPIRYQREECGKSTQNRNKVESSVFPFQTWERIHKGTTHSLKCSVRGREGQWVKYVEKKNSPQIKKE